MQMPEQLTPRRSDLQTQSFVAPKDKPSRTYKLDVEQKRVFGFVDTQRAMEQAIFKILNTWLYAQDIYSDQYGFEGYGLIGRSRKYVESEIKRRIQEALYADERITRVYQFEFEKGERSESLTIRFRVKTIFSDFAVRQEVFIT